MRVHRAILLILAIAFVSQGVRAGVFGRFWDFITGAKSSVRITTTALPKGYQCNPYSFQLSATGGKPPYIWKATGQPSTMAMSSGGILSAPVGLVGSWSIQVTVSDRTGRTAAGTFPLASTAAPPLVITSPDPPPGVVGQPYSFQLTAAGGCTGN